jgi:TolA-binding protein
LSKGNTASLRAGRESRPISASQTAAARQQLADLVESGLVSEQTTAFATEHDAVDVAEEPAEQESAPDASLEPEASGRTVPTLQALRREAQAHRSAGRWKAAAESYRHIIATFPQSAEARTSLVALGQLQLEKLGQPAKAVRNFRRYLAGGGRGPLAREALYGRARAYRALGKKGMERADLSRFVAQFPHAIQVPRAKQRLAQLAQEEQ